MARPAFAAWRWLAVLLLLAGCAAPGPESSGAVTAAPVAGPPAGALPGEEDRVIVIAVANPVSPLPRLAGSTPGVYGETARYVAGAQARATLAALAREHGLEPLAGWPIGVLGLYCATLRLPAGAVRDTVLAALQRDPRVALAQPLQRFEAQALPAPAAYDDPYLPLQRALLQQHVPQAHRCARGRGVKLALIDTGVNLQHPDLRGLQSESANFVDGDAARFERDRHGTEMAGVIAARPGNGVGIVGIAPDVKLLALKACWETPDGRAVCNSFTLAQALAAAVDRGAGVINLSLGGPPDELLARLVRAAQARGALVVGATLPAEAGAAFPAGVPGVIAARDTATPGPGLGAPSRELLTLQPGGRYDFAGGSSLAAAQLSAMAALLVERRPRLDAATATQLLRDSGPAAAGPDACRALQAADAGCRCADTD